MKYARRITAIAFFLLAASWSGASSSHDLGTYGETFKVIEPNLLSMISGKLHAAEAAGKLDQMNRQFVDIAKKHIERPADVPGISTTTRARTWSYDPSIVVDRDYADNQGRVFAHAGDRINPLDRLPTFNKVMVFIDGDDKSQVALALRLYRKYGAERTKLILTSGAPLDVMRASKVQFDFDQKGYISGKLGITHVPSIVEREGDHLKIQEVLP